MDVEKGMFQRWDTHVTPSTRAVTLMLCRSHHPLAYSRHWRDSPPSSSHTTNLATSQHTRDNADALTCMADIPRSSFPHCAGR